MSPPLVFSVPGGRGVFLRVGLETPRQRTARERACGGAARERTCGDEHVGQYVEDE